MFRSLLMSLHGLVGSSLTRRRSWGSVLRSFAPARRWPSVVRLPEPTCRCPERPSRSFSSGDRPICTAAQYTHRQSNGPITDVQNRLLGFAPAGNPCRHRKQGLRRPILPWTLASFRSSDIRLWMRLTQRSTIAWAISLRTPFLRFLSALGLFLRGKLLLEMNGTVCCCRTLS